MLFLVYFVAMSALFFRQVSSWTKTSHSPCVLRSLTRLHSTWSSNQNNNRFQGNNQGSNPGNHQDNRVSSNGTPFGTGNQSRGYPPKPPGAESDEVKTFASYSVYKGKAALSIKPIPPTFQSLSKTSRIISREGSIFLEFAPAANGPREYNWGAKTVFSLDATECGALLVMDSSKGTEFTHDPKMGTPDAGQVMKKLSLNPTQDGKGVFFRLQSTDKEKGKSDISVLLTWAELEVVKTLMRYSIPRFLGVDKLFDSGSSEGN